MFMGQAALMAQGSGSPGAAAGSAIAAAAPASGQPDNAQVAEASLQRALDIDPNLVRAQVLLGSVYFKRAQALQGADRLETTDWEQAIAEFQKAIALAQAAAGPGGSPGATGGGTRVPGAPAPSPLDQAWGPDGAPLLALGQAYKIEGDAYLQTKQYDQAENSYNMAIPALEKSRVTLAAAGEHRLLGQADLSLGSAYWNKAVIRRVTNRAQEAGPLDSAAQAVWTECVAQGRLDQYDSVLADRVIAAGCQPGLERLASITK
jgi:tetratricopeptide (TPR) repeat protein